MAGPWWVLPPRSPGGGSGSDTVHLQVYSLETSYYYRLRSAQWLTNHTSLSTIDSFGDPLLGIAGLAGYGSAEYNMPAATGSPSGVWSGTTVYQRAWTWDREQMPLSMIGEGGTPTVTCDQQLGTAPGGTIGIRALFEFDVFDITQGLDWHAQVEHIT